MNTLLRWIWLITLVPAGVAAAVVISDNPETGLRSWIWRERGVSLELVQRLPDQDRAFFAARGFSRDEADRIARACVFQTIFRNDGASPLAYDLDDWVVLHAGASQSLLTRERRNDIWRESEVSQAARIAQHWALLPTRQRFEPGDYNWGMTSYGLPPGSAFDLELVVTLGGDRITRRVAAVVCADDRTVEAP